MCFITTDMIKRYKTRVKICPHFVCNTIVDKYTYCVDEFEIPEISSLV